MAPGADSRSLRRGLLLEYATLSGNVVGTVIVEVRSVALAAFGVDSLIEIFASIVVVWQRTPAPDDFGARSVHLRLRPVPTHLCGRYRLAGRHAAARLGGSVWWAEG
jgi:hypothetical protein